MGWGLGSWCSPGCGCIGGISEKAGNKVVIEDPAWSETKVEMDSEHVTRECVVFGREKGFEIEGECTVAKPERECEVLRATGTERGLSELRGSLCDVTNEVCVAFVDDPERHREMLLVS